MPIYALGDRVPDIDPEAFVHPDAVVIGEVRLGAGASMWPTSVARGDFGRIEVGEETSIQDGTVLHATPEWPTLIGRRCIVGHNAHLEGCTIGDDCLIGSGSIVLNRCIVEEGAAVAAAALVSAGTTVPSGQMAVGIPARLRAAPGVGAQMSAGSQHYVEMARRYKALLRRLD
jgi:carbonic anhydrase/acetyltransferase-like protein (isoleucine patch superfamily)